MKIIKQFENQVRVSRSITCAFVLLIGCVCHSAAQDSRDESKTAKSAAQTSSDNNDKSSIAETAAPSTPAPQLPATPVEIGSRRELFVDDLIIGELSGTRLRLHQPHRLRRMPYRPFGHYATVLQDEDRLRLYYRGDKKPGAHWRNGWGAYHEGEVTLYAESSDKGLTWKEPDLGIYEIPEMPKGNVVMQVTDKTFLVTHNFTPFIDGRLGVPDSERYKALGGGRYPQENWGNWRTEGERQALRDKYGPGGLKAFASPDGIHWNLMQETPVISEDKGSFDSQNGAFWSNAEQKYVCYFRWFDKGRRAIRRSTSDDFLNWSEPVDMQANEPREHLYTSCTQPYFRAPHIYIALPTRFQASAGAITDIALMATRPGSDRYHRHFKEAFIRPGLGARGWGNRANYITLGIVQTSPNEMSMFMYGGAQYVMRLDGFISVNAGYEQGEFTTKPLVFSGSELEINYSTAGAGEIRVELQDADGKEIPGFTIGDCDPIKGDAISEIVSWKTVSDVSQIAGKTIRLRFKMREADLYSLKFD